MNETNLNELTKTNMNKGFQLFVIGVNIMGLGWLSKISYLLFVIIWSPFIALIAEDIVKVKKQTNMNE